MRNQLRRELRERQYKNLADPPRLPPDAADALSLAVAALVDSHSPPPSEAATKAALRAWLEA